MSRVAPQPERSVMVVVVLLGFGGMHKWLLGCLLLGLIALLASLSRGGKQAPEGKIMNRCRE